MDDSGTNDEPRAVTRRRARTVPSVPPWSIGVVLLVIQAWPRLTASDLWLDESYSLAAVHDLPGTVRATGATMATYYALLTPWGWIDASPAWVRLPSVVLMAAAIAVTSAFVGRMAGRRAAWWCAALAGATPMVVAYAAEARSYALACLLVALAWTGFERLLADPERWRPWAGLAVACSVLLPLTHGLAVLHVGLAGVAVLASRPPRRTVAVTLAAMGLAAATLAMQFTLGLGEVGDWIGPLNQESATLFVRLVLSRRVLLAWIVGVLAVIGAVIGAAGPGGTPVLRFRRMALLLWGPGFMAAVLLLSLVRPFQVPRYGISACFGLAGLVAVAISRFPLPAVARPLAAVLVLASAWTVAPPDRTLPWSSARDLVADQAIPGDQILFGGQESRLPFEAAWIQTRPNDLLEVVGYGGPLGTFGRFDRLGSTQETVAEIDPSRRLWVVQSLMRADEYIRPVRTALVDGGVYVQAGRWQANKNTIVWLYVRPA